MTIDINTFKKDSRYLRSDYTQMWMLEDVLFIQYNKSVIIDIQCAKKVLEDRLKISQEKPHFVHGDCRGVDYWTKEARKFQSTKENAAYIIAGTVVYSNIHPINVALNFYLKFNKLHYPVKFCTSNLEGLNWLFNFRAMKKDPLH